MIVPPTGTIEKATNAGTTAITGAIRYTSLSAVAGSSASLKNSLMPSARDCSQPNGPARFGPQRVPSRAMALRSYMIMKSTETIKRANTAMTLTSKITQTTRSRPFAKRGSPV